MRGYQFSPSDLRAGDDIARMYETLDRQFAWFHAHLAASGLNLIRDGGVILLEKDARELSKEERQTVVALFLLADLWLEQRRSSSDLFVLPVRWRDLPWFREGYGRDYLEQVGISDLDDLERLWEQLERRGMLTYHKTTMTLTLRDPAGRIIALARRVHQQLRADEEKRNGDDERHCPNGADQQRNV